MNYQMTRLEQKIKEIYYELGIYLPHEIDPYHIANEYNVWIYFHDNVSEVYKRREGTEDLYSMYLDERLSLQEQWQDFCHEFGHVVEHVGNQDKLRKPFKKLQERQANNFMYHFAVPTFMLLNYELANYHGDGITFIIEKFNVTREFAFKRLEMFRRQLNQVQMDKQFMEIINNKKVINYCKNIEPKEVPVHAKDIVALAISRKLAKEGVSL
ncbi:ImmA/IrrE family metallo-endopeptidase [Metabacillus halosaccharovorans]|uniref:ImmA/IrrE family metallo-endopeptidase n=1 Tax=Metabacillus halosaccharovorans TaxID=930124 RepID=UPI0034CF933E